MTSKTSSISAFTFLHRDLNVSFPADRLLDDPVSTLAHAGDASFYRLVPRLVVKVLDEKEASIVLAACSRHRVPITFRAAGTSLSGQSVTDSVLMPIARSFSRAEVLDQGRRIRLQPAIIGAAANRLLAPYGRKLGPDPASIDAAMIGGIAANNASGICCGTAWNCYRTLDSLRLVLADGTVLDTADAASRKAFASSHGPLLEGLSRLAAEVQADAGLRDLIARKYRMKNTTGYSLNALADFQDPFEILEHLLIGSEGTLAFISGITLRTVTDPPCKAAVLAFFPDASAAGRTVSALASAPVQALEYMDGASLKSVSRHPDIAAAGDLDGCSALLIDIRGSHQEELQAHLDAVRLVLSDHPAEPPPLEAVQDARYQSLWSIRKGLFPAIGSLRPPGTTIIIEDVAFPVDRLAEALADLRGLLDGSGYKESIIYGHALAGNLHFVFWQDFGRPEEVERYAEFMERLSSLVLDKYQGSLKAEHGTGRNMAPFVEREWGKQAYGLMHKVKALFDPLGILNPDVVLSDDNLIHLKNLKPLPLTNSLVDKCIECGFCENVCPSRNLTLTPRQRIAVRREISWLGSGSRADRIRLKALARGFSYAGEQTCATDGLCALKCPVGIDTGALIKSLRREAKPAWQAALAGLAARHFDKALAGLRLSLRLYHGACGLPGGRAVPGILRSLGRIMQVGFPPGAEYLPRPARPPAAPKLGSARSRKVLYFPSCINRTVGPQRPGDPPLVEVITTLLRLAGFEVQMPVGMDRLCCGLAFASKGFEGQGRYKADEMRATLLAQGWADSDLVCDSSPCSQRLAETLGSMMRVHDSADFLAREVLPRLGIAKRKGTVAIHPTCSLTHMGLEKGLAALAEACSEQVVIPEGMSCCGVAGDRIFTHPELVHSACAPLRSGLPAGCAEGYSTSRTCEIGLTATSGLPYRSIAYLLHETADLSAQAPPAQEDSTIVHLSGHGARESSSNTQTKDEP